MLKLKDHAAHSFATVLTRFCWYWNAKVLSEIEKLVLNSLRKILLFGIISGHCCNELIIQHNLHYVANLYDALH